MSPQPDGAPSSFYEALGALFVVIAWSLREMVPALRRRWARSRVRQVKAGYEGIVRMIDALEEGRRACGASRALFIISRNSGGVPVPGVPVKVSVRYEAARDSTPRIHALFQDWVPDAPYCELLRMIANSGGATINLVTERMMKGTLRDRYEVDGVIGSKVCLIGHVPNGSWMAYVSFHFCEGEIDVEGGSLVADPGQREAVRVAVAKIRGILREYHEVLV